jgi:hypothetical protein
MPGVQVRVEEVQQRFELYDVNRDNRVSLDEFITKYLEDIEACKQEITNDTRLVEESEKQKEALMDKQRDAKVTVNLPMI